MRLTVGLILVAARLACASVDNPQCEKTGEQKYKISFETSGKGEQVTIYASSHADRIDPGKALAKTSVSPVEVNADSPGRIYFHLKPRKGPVRVVAVRRIDVEGTYNTRDIGGYRAADGRYVRWGLIYRSDQLHDMTDRDYKYLSSLGLKLVCDFRIDKEQAESPTDQQRFPSAGFASLSIDSYGGRYGQPRGGSGTARAVAATGASGPPAPAPYNWMALAVPQYATVLHRIAGGEVPILFHCFAGKDRTGMMAGLILSLLGVPRNVILDDYMATAAVRRNAGVTRGQMEATFQSIDKKYGSVDAYAEQEMKLTAADVSAIRNRLLY